MKLKTLEKTLVSTKTAYFVYNDTDWVEYFEVDYDDDDLAKAICKRRSYGGAEVTFINYCDAIGAIAVTLDTSKMKAGK